VDPGAAARVLEARRAELRSELDALTAVPRDPMAAVSFGKRIGDGTTEAIGRMERVGQADALAATLADVERALEKVADGTYGLCDRCGASIPDERLEAIPMATRCMRCASAR
jgi:RNA polymerase-binding transcription factor